jgi:hypothetical protein
VIIRIGRVRFSLARSIAWASAENGPMPEGARMRADGTGGRLHCAASRAGLAQREGLSEMSEQKRTMRPHEKGLAALWALLIGIITLSALRIRFTEWLKRSKST